MNKPVRDSDGTWKITSLGVTRKGFLDPVAAVLWAKNVLGKK